MCVKVKDTASDKMGSAGALWEPLGSQPQESQPPPEHLLLEKPGCGETPGPDVPKDKPPPGWESGDVAGASVLVLEWLPSTQAESLSLPKSV